MSRRAVPKANPAVRRTEGTSIHRRAVSKANVPQCAARRVVE